MAIRKLIETIEFEENMSYYDRIKLYYNIELFLESFVKNFKFDEYPITWQNILLKGLKDTLIKEAKRYIDELKKQNIFNIKNYQDT